MSVFKVITRKDSYKDQNIYRDLIHYITREDKARSHYIVLCGVSSIRTAASEMEELARRFNKEKGTRVRHMVLSFDPSEEISPRDAYQIASRVVDYYSSKYQIIAAVHEDKDCVHIHMMMNVVHMHTGYKYDGKKKDYYKFIAHIKSVLSPYRCKVITQK